MNQFILAFILTILPLTELRVGLPIALLEASKRGISTLPVFALVIFLNILVIFIAFFFLDYIHSYLLNFRPYSRFYSLYLNSVRKRVDKFEKRYSSLGFFALFLFVSVPLPLTGAYTGVFLSWVLGLERKKSIISISLGVLSAGIIIYLGTLGVISFLN